MPDYSDIAKMFEDMELRIVANLKEQLNNGYDLNPNDWQVKKLRNLNAFRQSNIKIMNDYKPLAETKKLIEDNFQNGVTEAEKFVGQPHFSGINEERMNKLIDDMTALEKHVETAALRMTDDVYRRTLHTAALEMSAGTSLEKAIDMAAKNFLNQGINCIIYADGRHVNIADYVRMALRTAGMKATLQGKSGRFSQLGYDTVLISQYDKCSDTCLPYQGRVYIDDTFTLWDGEVEEIGGELWGKSNYCGKWFPLLSTAIYGGLFHPNCRHDMDLYIDGKTTIPEPIDSEKDLENYRLQQRQRAMERNIRKLRRMAAGSCDEQTAKAYSAKVRTAQKELREFINANSTVLHREFDREKIYDKTYKKSLTKDRNSDIIKSEEVSPLEQAKKRDHKIYITDIAIEKVSKTNISYLSSEQNDKIYEAHKELLRISKTQNDSNEVAYLFNLGSDETAYQLGRKHEVNIFKNPYALSMANSTKNAVLFLAHNHPSTQDFSYSDIGVLLLNDNFKAISVVSNMGDVHILYKSSKYDFQKAMDYIKSVRLNYGESLDDVTDGMLVKDILKGSEKIGILQY